MTRPAKSRWQVAVISLSRRQGDTVQCRTLRCKRLLQQEYAGATIDRFTVYRRLYTNGNWNRRGQQRQSKVPLSYFVGQHDNNDDRCQRSQCRNAVRFATAACSARPSGRAAVEQRSCGSTETALKSDAKHHSAVCFGRHGVGASRREFRSRRRDVRVWMKTAKRNITCRRQLACLLYDIGGRYNHQG